MNTQSLKNSLFVSIPSRGNKFFTGRLFVTISLLRKAEVNLNIHFFTVIINYITNKKD